MIRLENIVKDYATGSEAQRVLKGVSLSIGEGEFVAIMGPSGSGKSTMMNIIGCLDRPTSGAYYLDGSLVSEMDEDELAAMRRVKLGFVFQGFNLLPRRTINENVSLPLIYTDCSVAEMRERAESLLELVGLKGYGERRPTQLSGGQQQRVAIARALVNHPKVILADEPTGNLDTKTSEDIMAVFTALNREKGITIMLVTHEPDVANYARRVVHIRDGIIDSDTVKEQGQ